MRYVKAFALAVVLTLFLQNVIQAEDYLTGIVQALQRAPVYVAPGTEGTDGDTAAKLQARLTKDDNIVLVMLPAAAEKDLGTDIASTASRLSEMLGNRRIIGLAVGRKVAGFAPYLPPGVASDQMKRAESVSNDSVTALGTFVQNMHIWQRENSQQKPPPTPTPTPMPTPTPAPKSSQQGSFSWVLVLAVIGVAITVSAMWRYAASSTRQPDEVRIKFDAPRRVSELLTKIALMRSKVNDEQLQEAITQICKDSEIYFAKYCSEPGKDALLFETHLHNIFNVLTKYVEVQNFERYYDNPTNAMQQGKEAIKNFAMYVLNSCKRGSAARLLDYTVDTQILSAQRYR